MVEFCEHDYWTHKNCYLTVWFYSESWKIIIILTLNCVILEILSVQKLCQKKQYPHTITIYAATKWLRSAVFDAGIDDSASSLLPTQFLCKWRMCTTCYGSVSQQPLSQAQIHISWSSACVGGQTPFHVVTARISPYVCANSSASLSRQLPSYGVHVSIVFSQRGDFISTITGFFPSTKMQHECSNKGQTEGSRGDHDTKA